MSSRGYELVPIFVMEQDRGGVRVERVANSRQQLGEELIELEMGERGVGDELNRRRRSASPLGGKAEG